MIAIIGQRSRSPRQFRATNGQEYLAMGRRSLLQSAGRGGARALAAGLLAGVAVAGVAWAAALPFDLVAFGSFRRMNHTGDTQGQVKLAELPSGEGAWGVGALAGLVGEVVLHDGRLLVSRGQDHKGAVSPALPGDEAAIFVAARVRKWAYATVPADMDRARFEAFVVEEARAQGVDPEQPFPFLVDGRFPALTWHVVTGAANRGTGHGGGAHANQHAGMKVFEQPGASGRLVAFFSGTRLEGVVSHPGERLHVHYIDGARSASGHVDDFAVARGAVVRIPLR